MVKQVEGHQQRGESLSALRDAHDLSTPIQGGMYDLPCALLSNYNSTGTRVCERWYGRTSFILRLMGRICYGKKSPC